MACCLRFEADRVVPERGLDGDLIEQFFEHIDRDAGVSVTLGV